MERYFEDVEVGQRHETGSLTVTEEAIVAFAREYDPQDFHLGNEQAKKTQLGRLIASGWQTTAWTMRLLVDGGTLGRGGGLGIGVDELRWKKPVYPGDTLRAVAEVVDKRPSASRPTGVVRMRVTTYNQHDEPVLEETTIVMLPRRPAAS